MPDGIHADKQRTIRDLLLDGMNVQGVSEVPCVEFELSDGSIIDVLTDTNPVLNRPASDVKKMKFKTSAEAGSVVEVYSVSGSYITDSNVLVSLV